MSINFSLFKYIIENAINKKVNIKHLYKETGTDVSNLYKTIEIIHPHLKKQTD